MRPKREPATQNNQSDVVTTETWSRQSLLNHERWANLLIGTLYNYRGSAYLLHAFVLMPDHVHILITPPGSLEKAVQFVKGGFYFRAKMELGSNMQVWQKGFQDHRIRDGGDFAQHIRYIQESPVRRLSCKRASDYPYSSAHSGFKLDAAPQGLKPQSIGDSNGAAEAAPLQSNPKFAPLQSNRKFESFQSKPQGANLRHKNADRSAEGLIRNAKAKTV
jgi:putative transposase